MNKLFSDVFICKFNLFLNFTRSFVLIVAFLADSIEKPPRSLPASSFDNFGILVSLSII